MSDRRPHWDAELLDAVGRSMHAFYDRPDAMHVYAVIAAAEDWIGGHPTPCVIGNQYYPGGLPEKMREQKAAIERVREACKAKQGPRAHDDPYNRGWDAALTWVERALDGPQ